jgi:hypothetical protein
MTVRKIAGALPFLVVFALFQPLEGQDPQGFQWTLNRPDAPGPVSLSEARVLRNGEFQVGLKFINQQMKGQGFGTDSLTVNQVLTFFDVAPSEMVVQGFEVDLLWGLTSHLTLTATGTVAHKKMDNLAALEGQSNVFLFYQTTASGLQDVKVNALYNVYDQGAVKVHVSGGVSIPVGAIDTDDETPFSGSGAAQLPYSQQLGSGTVDLLPGFTFNTQNEKASLGVQGKAVIRLGENDRGWTLGDVYEGTLWGGYKATDWASVSMGARYSTWGMVEGFDEAVNPNESPAHNTLTQAGWRVDLPLGLNLLLPEGRFGGHRVGLEILVPLHQDLDGPQFMHNWTIVAGWQKSMGF